MLLGGADPGRSQDPSNSSTIHTTQQFALSRGPWLEPKGNSPLPWYQGGRQVCKRFINKQNKLDWQRETTSSLNELSFPGVSKKPQLCSYEGLPDGRADKSRTHGTAPDTAVKYQGKVSFTHMHKCTLGRRGAFTPSHDITSPRVTPLQLCIQGKDGAQYLELL